MKKAKIGLLPLYLGLYDKVCPERRPDMENFVNLIRDELTKLNINVIKGEICRHESEFEKTISNFENENADAIVSLHLAYSPSLESTPVVAKTKLPLIILDTTPDFEFGPEQEPDKIMFNHGIHGVQDFCNMLIRLNKPFTIEAGHWRESDVLNRVSELIKAAQIASNLRNSRVGIIGEPFKGMGDFAVPFQVMKETIGIDTIEFNFDKLSEFMPEENSSEVEEELKNDQERFDTSNIPLKIHRCSIRSGLAVRKWVEQENLTAFTMNFLSFGENAGFPTVPFLEASKAMAKGIGYGGEGDVLCAALTGAIAQVFPETTFTEMFCPDWKDNRIFMAHMGEMNINLTTDKSVLVENQFPIEGTEVAALAAGSFKPGQATLINLAPGPDNSYSLIHAPIEICKADGDDKMSEKIRGWIKPQMNLNDFLAAYSRAGGTHHKVMTYGNISATLSKAAEFLRFKNVSI